jgi:hypothetical protein
VEPAHGSVRELQSNRALGGPPGAIAFRIVAARTSRSAATTRWMNVIRSRPPLALVLAQEGAHRVVGIHLARLDVPLPQADACHPGGEPAALEHHLALPLAGDALRDVARDDAEAADVRVVAPVGREHLEEAREPSCARNS